MFFPLHHPLPCALALAACLFAPQVQAQAEPAPSPRQLIEKLGVEIRQRLESPQPGKTPADAERDVAKQIASRIRGAAGDPALTEPDSSGMTPLMLAASGAYPLVVQALLADPSVQSKINATNVAGETAWMLANFAPRMTLAACQPGVLTVERVSLLPPYVRRMATFLQDEGKGLASIVQALEGAGAQVDVEAAKRVWLQGCPYASPELRKKLAGNVPLLSTLVTEAVTQQLAFNKALAETPSSAVTRPPEDMKFIPASDTPPEQLEKSENLCPIMTKPQLHRLGIWTGQMRFKATIATRAGVVELVDLELRDTRKPHGPHSLTAFRVEDRAAMELFRSAILGGLAGYQCEGDHVFEQEFEFKVD